MTSPHTSMPETIRDHDDTGVFSTVAWHRTARVREAIDALPLLHQLSDATLAEETFRHYLAQDALYLADYGRVLAAAAAQAQAQLFDPGQGGDIESFGHGNGSIRSVHNKDGRRGGKRPIRCGSYRPGSLKPPLRRGWMVMA